VSAEFVNRPAVDRPVWKGGLGIPGGLLGGIVVGVYALRADIGEEQCVDRGGDVVAADPHGSAVQLGEVSVGFGVVWFPDR
jgi:prolipoprotein diacylglyceryltransferase